MNTQMKQKSSLGVLCLCLMLCLSANLVQAQYNLVGPPVNADITVANAAVGNTIDWLNNAVFTNSYGTVWGEAWDEGTGTDVWMELHDNTGSTGPIQLGVPMINLGASVRHPDIVLGGDDTHNYVAVVYKSSSGLNTDIFLEIYTITNVNAGIGVFACTKYIFQLTNTHASGDPHIDLANEQYGAASVKADLFAVAWEEGNALCVGNGGPGARGCYGLLSNLAGSGCVAATVTNSPGCFNVTGLGGTRGTQVDIAVHLAGSAGYVAGFTYSDPVLGNIYLGTWNITAGTITTGTMMNNPGANAAEFPRIDLLDQNRPFTPCTEVDVVYRYFDPGPLAWNVNSTNNLIATGWDEVTSYYNTLAGTFNNDNSKPVVTAGSNNNVNAADNNFFSVAYAGAQDIVWVQNIDWTTGVPTFVAGPDYNYYEVNTNANISDPVAISSNYVYVASNFRTDEIYTCWINTSAAAQSIDCKSSNTIPPAFKPTGTKQLSTAANRAKIYPNPANDILYVECGAYPLKAYVLSDLLGRNVLEGELTKESGAIDISKLAKGMYLLKLQYDGSSYTDCVKVVKD